MPRALLRFVIVRTIDEKTWLLKVGSEAGEFSIVGFPSGVAAE
jgi:hypothetical protein